MKMGGDFLIYITCTIWLRPKIDIIFFLKSPVAPNYCKWFYQRVHNFRFDIIMQSRPRRSTV